MRNIWSKKRNLDWELWKQRTSDSPSSMQPQRGTPSTHCETPRGGPQTSHSPPLSLLLHQCCVEINSWGQSAPLPFPSRSGGVQGWCGVQGGGGVQGDGGVQGWWSTVVVGSSVKADPQHNDGVQYDDSGVQNNTEQQNLLYKQQIFRDDPTGPHWLS